MRWQKDPVLTVEHLTMRFGGLVAVNDLSFDAGRGDITALIGPNGAGKTTVFNCITGFYKPSEGMVTLRKTDDTRYLLERLPGHSINWKAKVARTFQNIRLFSGMTVLENLLVAQHNPLMIASGFTFLGVLGVGGYRQAEKEAIDRATRWLEKIRLIDRADDPAGDLPYGAQRRLEIVRRGVAQVPEGRRIFPRMSVFENLQMGAVIADPAHFRHDLDRVLTMFPRLAERREQRGGTLSGGEQQMLAIGRALMSRPRLLLLDEPSLGLAPLIVRHIFEAIARIARDEGVTIFLVEQNAFHALRLADRGYVLVNGRVRLSGTGQELLANQEVRAAYLEGGHA